MAAEKLINCSESLLQTVSSLRVAAGVCICVWHGGDEIHFVQSQSPGQMSPVLMRHMCSVRAVANNLPALNRRVDARTRELKDAESARRQALVQLSVEISDLLQELEESYYATPPS